MLEIKYKPQTHTILIKIPKQNNIIKLFQRPKSKSNVFKGQISFSEQL